MDVIRMGLVVPTVSWIRLGSVPSFRFSQLYLLLSLYSTFQTSVPVTTVPMEIRHGRDMTVR